MKVAFHLAKNVLTPLGITAALQQLMKEFFFFFKYMVLGQ